MHEASTLSDFACQRVFKLSFDKCLFCNLKQWFNCIKSTSQSFSDKVMKFGTIF